MHLLLLSSLALAAFYLLYKWLLSRDTFHRFNRVVILVLMAATTLFPFVAPFMHLRLGPATSEMSLQLRELVVTPDRAALLDAELPQASLLEAATPLTSLQSNNLLYISLAVTAVFLIVIVCRLEGLRRRCRRHFDTLPDGTRLVLHDDSFAPFSWMHYVVCSHKDYAANGPTILAHEQAHIRLHHSWDLLLAQVCCAVQWFNPAAWLMKRELQAVHEYEADEAMLHSGCNAAQYQMKLIETALGARFSSIANNFCNVKTKKRILMMMKTPTSPWARLKVLILLPVAAAAIFAASCTNAQASTNTDAEAFCEDDDTTKAAAPEVTVLGFEQADSTKTAPADNSPVLDVCEVLPVYPGGMEELMNYLCKNLRYPKEAQDAKKQGRVIVQFIVEKDGSINETKVVKSVDPQIDAEALRVVRAMPKWTPGKDKGQPVRCKFVIPVAFRLQ